MSRLAIALVFAFFSTPLLAEDFKPSVPLLELKQHEGEWQWMRGDKVVPAVNSRLVALFYQFSIYKDEATGWTGLKDGKTTNLPVIHVSARDAQAYADWLAKVSGQRYRLPSEAEFEYALRAGGVGRYPWGEGEPPERVGNLTGGEDRSPGGRGWSNAFDGYDDGHWGPAPVGSFTPNAFGLHDLEGNVSEWVADCWHDSYRRAPATGAAWVNPGCRMQVVRGGAWASAPPQTRSSWRAPSPVDNTNARVGFRVARDI